MTEEHVPVRLSHLLRECSVGAVVRGPDSLMVVQDVRTWDRLGADPLEREIRYVDRVRSALDIEQALCAPPRAVERDGTIIGWVPALRFPTWMRCLNPKCGLMHRAPWRKPRANGGDGHRHTEAQGTGGAGEAEKCGGCGGRLEQTPWVLVHEDGLSGGRSLARSGASGTCPQPRTAPVSSRLDAALPEAARDRSRPHRALHPLRSRKPACRRARCRGYRFHVHIWQQPWMREPPAQAPETPALLLEINDVRVHSASTRTALVIPPESRIRRGTVTDRLYSSTRKPAPHLGTRGTRWRAKAPSDGSPANIAARPARSRRPSRKSRTVIPWVGGRSPPAICWRTSTGR